MNISETTIKIIGIDEYGYKVIDKLVEHKLKYANLYKLNSTKEDLNKILGNTNLIFIIVDTFNKNSENIANAVATEARQKGIITIAILSNEINQLIQNIDSYAIFDFQSNSLFKNVFSIVKCVSYVISEPGLIYAEFEDIKNIFRNHGKIQLFQSNGNSTEMNSGITILKSVLNEKTFRMAKSILFNITGSCDLALCQVDRVIEYINSLVPKNTEIVFGASVDSDLHNEMQITLLTITYNTFKNKEVF